VENEQRKKLDNILLTYNLTGIVDFPRINHTSSSATDNIFLDISSFEDYSVHPFANDLSDHDAQILTIKILFQMQTDRLKIVRIVDKHNIRFYL
jgi:hypothetical protein